MRQYRVDLHGRYFGQDIVNTHTYVEGEIESQPGPFNTTLFDQGPPPTTGGLRAIANAFVTRFEAAYKATSVSALVYDTIRVASLSPIVAKRVSASIEINWPGDNVVPGLPANQCAVITRRPNPGQRKLNGRIFIAGIAVGDVDGGVINPLSDTGTGLSLIRDALVGALVVNASGITQLDYAVVAFRRAPTVRQVYFSFPTNNDSFNVKLQLRSQRRRLPGHGRTG